MEMLVATGVGAMTAAGVYLLLRGRTYPVVLGLALLSYAVNVFLFASGRLAIDQPPILSESRAAYTDPLPQALVLTAIVISFGMTALVVVLALRAFLESGTDTVALGDEDPLPAKESVDEAIAAQDAADAAHVDEPDAPADGEPR